MLESFISMCIGFCLGMIAFQFIDEQAERNAKIKVWGK